MQRAPPFCSVHWAGCTCPLKVSSRLQVNTSIDDWKTTRWKDINVEQMDIDCKKFAKDIRSLDKEMRSWDAFTGLDNNVKNMMTSLRAVNELQNPAIRDRHWHELMQATKVCSGPTEGRLHRGAVPNNVGSATGELHHVQGHNPGGSAAAEPAQVRG